MTQHLALSILGNLVSSHIAFDLAIQRIKTDFDFTYVGCERKAQDAFECLCGMAAQNNAWEVVSAAHRIKQSCDIPFNVVTEWAEEKISSDSAFLTACDQLRQDFERQLFKRQLQRTIAEVDDPDTPIESLVGQLQSSVVEGQMELTSSVDMANAYIERINQPVQQESRHLETRIADLNRLITGFYPGEYVIVAAPPSFGKTSFALDAAIFNAWYSKNTLYFALDQSADSMNHRLFANLTGISKERYHATNKSEQEKQMLAEAAQSIRNWKGKIHFDFNPNMTMPRLKSVARRRHKEHPLDLIVVDYVQQLTVDSRQSRYEAMTMVSRDLKALAAELNCVIFVVSQLSREWDKGNARPNKEQWPLPRLSMLRDSGSFEQDCNTAIFCYRYLKVLEHHHGEHSEEYQKEKAKYPDGVERSEIIVAKQKEGATGHVPCMFNQHQMRYYSQTERSL